MTSKHFCLKWTKFQTNILSAFESLQSTEDLADVTLTCEGINIRAHKFILSACSPYFRTIFKENPCSHPIVILKDVCHSDLMAIVNFMYQGEVTISEEQLSSFLHTAMILQVSGLMTTSGFVHKRQPPQSMPPHQQKKTPKPIVNADSPPECPPPKKVKVVVSKRRRSEEQDVESFEVVEVDRIKTEDEADIGNNNDIDIGENVEVIVNEKETQGSILEAALEIKDKPSSILERSLTSQSGKSPNPVAFAAEKLPDVAPKLYDKKQPDPSNSAASAPFFNYSAVVLENVQQLVKTEVLDHSDALDVMSPEELNFQIRNVELQPHHSSQCGNCPHCGKVYSNQSALKYHVRLVHSDLTNMYCCHLCPESFDYREGYKKHMAEVHLIRN